MAATLANPDTFRLLGLRGEKPAPERGTAVVSGTLAFAGTDYLIIRVPHGNVCIDILIPYTAIGMIVVPPMMA